MSLDKFIRKVEFKKLNELQRVAILAFFLYITENIAEFDLLTISEKLVSQGFGKPNIYRLEKAVLKSKNFIKGTKPKYFRLHNKVIEEMSQQFPFLLNTSENIETSNSILPEDLYTNTRGFIIRLAAQINAAYENNISDGCAILMRRLLEVLLIIGYRAKNRESEIIESGNDSYKKLTAIIDYTLSNKILPLQKDTREVLHDFRVFGNFSAHGITYNCRKDEITKVARKFRFAVEDLLYAAELKK